MLDPNKLGIQFKDERPQRDASLIYIFGEGKVREKDYFDFFEGKSSRLKIKVFGPTDNQSAPDRLLENAEKILKQNKKEKIDQIWFVIDVDRYERQDFIQKCKQKKYEIVVSNPSFEVWLYYHFRLNLPRDLDVNWKNVVDKLISGGFDSNIHPLLLETAIVNSKTNFKGTPFFPEKGATSVFLLGEVLLSVMQSEINNYLLIYKNHPKLKLVN